MLPLRHCLPTPSGASSFFFQEAKPSLSPTNSQHRLDGYRLVKIKKMFRERKVEEPSQSLSLSLTASEMEMLQWLTQKAELDSPAELIEDFVADLTGSWRNGGSDERCFTFDWFKRRGYVGGDEYPLANEALDWQEEENQ